MLEYWKQQWLDISDLSEIKSVSDVIGGRLPKYVRYESPVRDNFGKRNGECVYKALEACCLSYGEKMYDAMYWMKLNGINPEGESISGVAPNDVISLVRKSEKFSASLIPVLDMKKEDGEIIYGVPNAFTHSKRVLIATTNHMAVLRRIDVYTDNSFRIYVAETNRERTFAYKELFNRVYEFPYKLYVFQYAQQ